MFHSFYYRVISSVLCSFVLSVIGSLSGRKDGKVGRKEEKNSHTFYCRVIIGQKEGKEGMKGRKEGKVGKVDVAFF